MARAANPFKTMDDLWPKVGWGVATSLIVVSFILGFMVVGRAQQDGVALGPWAAICRGLGLTSDSAAAAEPRPPLRVPSRIAWTPETLAKIASGNVARGQFVALNCTVCHGAEGMSRSSLYPSLAGMEAAAIFKQLDDFRTGHRSSGVMGAISQALSTQDSADVAAYFASRHDGLPPTRGEPPGGGHTFRESDVGVRLVFAGDPARGIPPCSACHGPSTTKFGAPRLTAQQPAYIERELGAFAQGSRRNDINEQMRTIAGELTEEEMHTVAWLYGGRVTATAASR